MTPAISVVIPCYRQAHFLAEALASVAAQTLPPTEIVVVDHASPDQVESVVRRFPAVRHVRAATTEGVSAARNRGMAACSGEYLVFLDADDRLLPNAFAFGARALAARPEAGFVWGRRRLIDSAGKIIPAVPKVHLGEASYEDLLRENLVGPPVCAMFRRSVVAELGGFGGGLRGAEDYDLYLRVARIAPAVGHGDLVAEYRIHPASMSADPRAMLLAALAVLERHKPWVAQDARLGRALAAGMRLVRRTYDGEQRLAGVQRAVRSRRWAEAVRAGVVLAYRYPGLLFPVLLRRIGRGLVRS